MCVCVCVCAKPCWYHFVVIFFFFFFFFFFFWWGGGGGGPPLPVWNLAGYLLEVFFRILLQSIFPLLLGDSNGNLSQIFHVHDPNHTHSLVSFQWSVLFEQWTLRLTENCLQIQKCMGAPTRGEEWFGCQFVLTRWELVQPVPTKAVLQPGKAMCMACHDYACPPQLSHLFC